MTFRCRGCTVPRPTSAASGGIQIASRFLTAVGGGASRALVTVACVALSAATATGQSAPVRRSLTQSQWLALGRGEPVQILESVSTSPWPRSIVFQFIDATPEECAAVLSDYELQATYIPRMKSSRVLGRRGANETDVEYVIDIPIYPDERSISRQHVTVDKGEYQVHWRTVVSDSEAATSVTTGLATFSAITNGRSGRSGTLMAHDQTVVPSSVFARVPYVRNKAIAASRDAARAIARQVERERQVNRDVLMRQVAHLRETLVSRPDSGKVIHYP